MKTAKPGAALEHYHADMAEITPQNLPHKALLVGATGLVGSELLKLLRWERAAT